MSFTAPKFTGVGRQLQTRVIAGDTLTFTTIKLGDGTMTTEPIAALTDLIHGIITLPVHEVRRNADYADVTGVFQNAGLSSGFYWREIGIFAADPDYPNDRSHDILYCYQNAAELAEYIPSASSAVIEKIIRVACVVGDAESVTVGLTSQAYAKAEDLQALEEQHSKDVERINDALDAVDPTKVTAKAEPADGDGVMIADSTDSGKAKRLLWSNVKAALGKLFVPLARKVNGKTLTEDVTLTAADIKMPDSEEDVGAAMAKRLRYDDNLGLKIKLKAHKSLEYMSFDSGEETDLNYSGGCLALPGWRSGPWGMQVRYDMRWNTLFTRRYFNEGSEWDDWVRLATCMPPEVHELPLASDCIATEVCYYYRTQENICHVKFAVAHSSGTIPPGNFLVATLPEGFRPKENIWRPAFGLTNRTLADAFANAHVYVDGKIIVDGASETIQSAWFDFSFIVAS